MKIGLTYDLRRDYLAAGYSVEETAELDREDTIEGIESALRGLGHEVVRIGNAVSLIERLAEPLWHKTVAYVGLGIALLGAVVISLATEGAKEQRSSAPVPAPAS